MNQLNKVPLDYDKISELMNDLKLNINKKEDELKNIINEKDIVIEELQGKIKEQDNKIENINIKLEKIIDAFTKDVNSKDKDFSQIKINLLEQEKSININTKRIINILDDISFEMNNKIIEQEKNILKELKNDEINMKLYEKIKEMEKAIYYNEQSLILNDKERDIKMIIQRNEHEKKRRYIEFEDIDFNHKMLEKLKDEFPEIKSFKGDINKIIKKYKELLKKKNDFDNLGKIQRIECEIEMHKAELNISIKKEDNMHEEKVKRIQNDYKLKQEKINFDLEVYKELKDIKNNVGNTSKLEEIRLQIESKEQELRQIQEKENMEQNLPLKNGMIQLVSLHEQYMLKLNKEYEISKLNSELEKFKRKYHIREEFEKKNKEVIKEIEIKMKKEEENIEKMMDENKRLKNEKDIKIEEEFKKKMLEIEKKIKEEEENIIKKENNLNKMKIYF